MRVLLGSGGFRTAQRRELLTATMRSFFGDIRKLLFVPYALADSDQYVELLQQAGLDAGYELHGIHRSSDPVAAVNEAEGIYIGGGNTFRLLHTLYDKGLLEPIRQRVAAGLPYMGVSAGSNVACPTMMTTNDMPIIMPPSFEALSLVPFQLNAHYFHGSTFVRAGEEFHEHFGETRDDRLREFHELNETTVVGLWEGGILRCEAGQVELCGAGARIFRRGEEPRDLAAGAVLPLDDLRVG